MKYKPTPEQERIYLFLSKRNENLLIKARAGKLLEALKLFDFYKGNQIQEGFKSVAYSMTFRALDRTLTDQEVAKIMGKIVNELESKLEAKLR